jgi:hypothetical protein
MGFIVVLAASLIIGAAFGWPFGVAAFIFGMLL